MLSRFWFAVTLSGFGAYVIAKLPPVASTVRIWIASTGSTAVPCAGEPFA